ncbi:MAG: hypothetical protein AAGD05_00080 [Bacteroidota bacterium]
MLLVLGVGFLLACFTGRFPPKLIFTLTILLLSISSFPEIQKHFFSKKDTTPPFVQDTLKTQSPDSTLHDRIVSSDSESNADKHFRSQKNDSPSSTSQKTTSNCRLAAAPFPIDPHQKFRLKGITDPYYAKELAAAMGFHLSNKAKNKIEIKKTGNLSSNTTGSKVQWNYSGGHLEIYKNGEKICCSPKVKLIPTTLSGGKAGQSEMTELIRTTICQYRDKIFPMLNDHFRPVQ